MVQMKRCSLSMKEGAALLEIAKNVLQRFQENGKRNKDREQDKDTKGQTEKQQETIKRFALRMFHIRVGT